MSILILDKYMLVRQILSEPGRDGWHRPVYGSSTPLQTQLRALELGWSSNASTFICGHFLPTSVKIVHICLGKWTMLAADIEINSFSSFISMFYYILKVSYIDHKMGI